MSKVNRGNGVVYSRIILKGVVVMSLLLVLSSTFDLTSKAVTGSDQLKLVTASESATRTLASAKGHSGLGDHPYQPAPVEEYILTHTKELGFNKKPSEDLVPTCNIWQDPQVSPYYLQLHQYFVELKDYYTRLNDFYLPPGVKDVRYDRNPQGGDVCELLELHPGGLDGIFKSQQLSRTVNNGYVEPLLPPMRHPIMCMDPDVVYNDEKYHQLVQIRYLVHDWVAMCRNIKPGSRTVFIDMGASLEFHGDNPSPALVLLEQFRRFGIVFDHIYAYEMDPIDPVTVQEAIPNQFRAAYHWINVGVEADPNSNNNPWNLLLENYHEDDLVVVKLDIDTPMIERQLAHQLFNNSKLAKLVDHFYFEHHVNQLELGGHWGDTFESVQDSFQLFHGLRQKGISSHFWV